MPIPGGSGTDPVSLADLKAALAETETTHDAVLQDVLDSAIAVVESMIGPINARTYTESYDGGSSRIVLRHVPVLSVSSVTENWGTINYTLTNQPVGQAVDAYGFDVDNPESGTLIRRTVGSFPMPFFPGTGNVTVTYTAGRATLPPNVKEAVIRQARLNWADFQSGRTSGKGARQQGSGPLPTVDPYVADLLRDDLMVPGIA